MAKGWAHSSELVAPPRDISVPIRTYRWHFPGISGLMRVHRWCLPGTYLDRFESIGNTSQMRCLAHTGVSVAPPGCISGPIRAYRQCLPGTFLVPYERIGNASQGHFWAHMNASAVPCRDISGPIRANQ